MDKHAKIKENSQQNLSKARDEASRSRKYNSEKTRGDLCRLVRERFENREPRDWQLDVAEALILSLDAVVIAPTGAGKTLPFFMPVLLYPTKIIIIISPLIALQNDQVFTKKFFKKGFISIIYRADESMQ